MNILKRKKCLFFHKARQVINFMQLITLTDFGSGFQYRKNSVKYCIHGFKSLTSKF